MNVPYIPELKTIDVHPLKKHTPYDFDKTICDGNK